MSRVFRGAVVLLLLSSGSIQDVAGREIVGWRTDGSGVYAEATPPVEWSAEKHVVWKTELPGRSYASPVVVDDRILVTSDSAELLCLRASDGKILWRRSHTVAEVLGEKKARALEDAWKKLNEEKKQLQGEHNELRKAQPEAKARLDKLRDQIKAVDARMQVMQRRNPVGRKGGAGNTAGTPVSDSKHVYAVFGTGIVAAYDLEGKHRWTRFVEGSVIGFGHSSSPVLVEDKLIVHFHDLIALDARSGKEIWRVELPATHATPLVTRIDGEAVLVSPAGAIVRVRDGKVLLTHDALRVSEGSPIVREGVVYAQAGKTSALRLPARSDEAASLEVLWQAQTAGGRRTPSPVIHNGLLYGVTTSGFLDVIDIKTGDEVYRARLNVGNIYSSPTVAGDHVYISSTRGVTLVLAGGRKYQVVARNELESFGSCPVFVGSRMYIRGQKHLYCIGK
jgi:outer membrane protein assembly factor BamB